jgi:hypothetical protein
VDARRVRLNPKVCDSRRQSRATQQDAHSVSVNYDVFVNAPKLDTKDLKTAHRLDRAGDFDFRLQRQKSTCNDKLHEPRSAGTDDHTETRLVEDGLSAGVGVTVSDVSGTCRFV